MADDPSLTFRVRGVEKLQAFLASVPYGTKKAAVAAAAAYLVGDENHGLAYAPARVEHGPDNPYQWQSDKQRRAYFASDGFGGGIPYNRTGDLERGWRYEPRNNGYDYRILNDIGYATYVQGDNQQKGHAADRWRKIGDIINSNINGAMQRAQQAVNRWLKENSGK